MRLPETILQQSQYCDRENLIDYLNSFSGQDPVKSVVCPFAQDAGAGIGLSIFSLLFFGGVGLALSVRVQHPGPVLVAVILTGGVAALSLPGQAVVVVWIVLLFGIAALGIYLYARAQTSL